MLVYVMVNENMAMERIRDFRLRRLLFATSCVMYAWP